jgi:hypothetical protein
MFKSEALRRLLASEQTADVCFLLFLDVEAVPPNSIGERAINFCVRNFQAGTPLAHVEVCVPPEDPSDASVFATYIGRTAQWSTNREENQLFYFGTTAAKWRAVPVFGKGAATAARRAADRELDTAYSLLRYPLATRALRWAAGAAPDGVGSPAHCANLAARVVADSLPLKTSNWYSPGTLYDAAVSRAAEIEILEDETGSDEAAVRVLGAPLSAELDEAEMTAAVQSLTHAVVRTLREGSARDQLAAQRRLAKMVLRWAV